MKKVLIISYFFPPCNLTASQRTYAWARYLKQWGYAPIVITRRWDHKINLLSDVSKRTGTEVVHEKNEDYELYAIPYKGNLRDKLYALYGDKKFTVLRRLLTFLELLLQNFFPRFIPYYDMLRYAEEIAVKEKDIDRVIISGNPFQAFWMGYYLHKKLGIKWVADYRDAWTTSEINQLGRSSLFRLVDRIDRWAEKRWVGTASLVTASSRPIADSITALTGVHSEPLYNGFMLEDFAGINPPKFEDFTITYVGTLYYGQKVEIMCEAFKKLVDQGIGIRARLLFPGLAFYPEQLKRIEGLLKGYEPYYEATPRIDRRKILEIEKRTHLLWHVGWDEQKGIIASKIYEYIASGTFIIVTPNDKGAIEEIIKASGCGVCTSTVEETYRFLAEEYKSYVAGQWRSNEPGQPNVMQFSREEQAKRLAALLKSS